MVREINSGGFGIVHEVLNRDGNRYARKTFRLNASISADDETVRKAKARFAREMRIQSQIRHSHVMPILHAELDAEPPWFLMPLADEDYTAQIDRDKKNAKISLEPLLGILAGLEELHRLGYVHRDLKPHNVLSLAGTWVISDLGLVLPTARDTTVITSVLSAWGTQNYAAPELVRDFRNAPTQSDIYSFGCLLHDIVGSRARVPYARVTEAGPVGAIIERCTEEDPSQRFPNISALRSALVTAIAAPVLVIDAPQVQAWVDLLRDTPETVDLTIWEEIIRFIERTFESDDAIALLQVMDMVQLEILSKKSPSLFQRFVPFLSKWIKTGKFNFDYCDVLAGRLVYVYEVGDIREKAESAVAMLNMGYFHNRYFVMRHFVKMAGPEIDDDLADRLAIEMFTEGKDALRKFAAIEGAIKVGRESLHTKIQNALQVIGNEIVNEPH